MILEYTEATLERMEVMLRRCRRRIMLSQLLACIRNGLSMYLYGLAAGAGFLLLFRVGCWIARTPIAVDGEHVIFVAAVFGMVVFGRAIVAGMWGKQINAVGAAERLDLAHSTHNRIATAMALLRCDDRSALARAAVRDGFEWLEKLQAELPYGEATERSWRREGACLIIGLVMLLTGQWFETDSLAPGLVEKVETNTAQVANLDDEPAPLMSNRQAGPNRRVASRDAPRPAGDAQTDNDTNQVKKDPQALPASESQSEGLARQHASGTSPSSRSSSQSNGATSEAGGKSESGKPEEAGKKPRPGRPPGDPPKTEEKNENSGSINPGGASLGGSMKTAQNERSREAKIRSKDSDEVEQEEEEDDADEEVDRDKERLGMQPALKNRNVRVSRELSLTMGTGLLKDMTKGRGGASSQKKSRGTATMIMGVPIPAVVRGRLLPGATKTTQEEVEPTAQEGRYAVASNLEEANPEEDPQERYHPGAALGVQARDYLIKLHTQNEKRRNGPENDK